MIKALCWKEYREHRPVWITMAVAAFLMARWVGFFMASSSTMLQTIRWVLYALVGAYGVVCGAMLLANERESGTLPFLDDMPARRVSIWRVKVCFGVALCLLMMAYFMGVGCFLGAFAGVEQGLIGVLCLVAFGFVGFGWGLRFSASSKNVLTAIGFACLALLSVECIILVASAIVGSEFSELFTRMKLDIMDRWVLFYWAQVFVAGLPLVSSARYFAREDRQRAFAADPVAVRRRTSLGLQAAVWLWWRQTRGFAAIMAGVVLFCGMIMPSYGLVIWPVMTLLLGVACGVTTLSDEQETGASSFLAEQRFPLGRFWLVKVGLQLVLTAGLLILSALPSLALLIWIGIFRQGDRTLFREQGGIWSSPLVALMVQPWVFLTLWVVYGFAVGLLCGTLFRKTLIALVVGAVGSAMLVSVWVPSLPGSGLMFWQLAGVPLLFVVAARVGLYPWATGRLLNRHPLFRLGLILLLGVLWPGVGLAYRAYDIPAEGTEQEYKAYIASLPKPEENEAGELTRRALRELATRRDLGAGGTTDFGLNRRPTRPLFPPPPAPVPAGPPGAPGVVLPPGAAGVGPAPFSESFQMQMIQVMERGWPKGESELGQWLDERFSEEWIGNLTRAADLPTGVVVDPRTLTVRPALPELEAVRLVDEMLAVRGLQEQARGNAGDYVNRLHTGLALSRNLEHKTVLFSALIAVGQEHALLNTLPRWLERLPDGPESVVLLRRVLKDLQDHVAANPSDEEYLMAEWVTLLNAMDRPRDLLNLVREQPRLNGPDFETDFLAFSWQVPWERERMRRLLYQVAAGEQSVLVNDRLMQVFAQSFGARRSTPFSQPARVHLFQSMELVVALRIYQAEVGRPATTLGDLVAKKILPAIPTDPFDEDEGPYGYRVSKGEQLDVSQDALGSEEKTFVTVAAGQGILESPAGVRLMNSPLERSKRNFHVDWRDVRIVVPLPAKP